MLENIFSFNCTADIVYNIRCMLYIVYLYYIIHVSDIYVLAIFQYIYVPNYIEYIMLSHMKIAYNIYVKRSVLPIILPDPFTLY